MPVSTIDISNSCAFSIKHPDLSFTESVISIFLVILFNVGLLLHLRDIIIPTDTVQCPKSLHKQLSLSIEIYMNIGSYFFVFEAFISLLREFIFHIIFYKLQYAVSPDFLDKGLIAYTLFIVVIKALTAITLILLLIFIYTKSPPCIKHDVNPSKKILI
uniref:Uncharacterized protein n=1 Tax=viral metagenome TaxID=1070528 RepID=A0A6C0CSJ6_9ZZZZ